MSEISLDSIKDKLNIDNYISEGKEVKCYRDNNEVIKIFHKERKSTLDMINEEGFRKLSGLQLKHFNKPIRLIYDGDKLNI